MTTTTTDKGTYVATNVAIFGSTSLDSLASSATWVAGRGSAVISNVSNGYKNVSITGRFKANNTAPTAGQIQVWVGGVLNDTPTYPDTITGSDAAITVTSTDIRNSIMRRAAVIITDTTTNRIYEFAPITLVDIFGHVPNQWWVWVTHSMVQTLNVTGSAGGQCWYQGMGTTLTTV